MNKLVPATSLLWAL